MSALDKLLIVGECPETGQQFGCDCRESQGFVDVCGRCLCRSELADMRHRLVEAERVAREAMNACATLSVSLAVNPLAGTYFLTRAQASIVAHGIATKISDVINKPIEALEKR